MRSRLGRPAGRRRLRARRPARPQRAGLRLGGLGGRRAARGAARPRRRGRGPRPPRARRRGKPPPHHGARHGGRVRLRGGRAAERILQALRSDEPLLAPRGRRLGAGEIRAAVAGRSLRGNEWRPRVDVSSFWGAGGELLYLDLRRGERRLAELRWRVEGDRLCTTRHGCGEVLADGRALHVFAGEPPRLAVTLLEDGPGAPPAPAAGPHRPRRRPPPARSACWSASASAATTTGSRAWRRRRCASGSAGRWWSRTCPGGRARPRPRRWPGRRRTAPRSASSRRR
jgi:hypothetical protein